MKRVATQPQAPSRVTYLGADGVAMWSAMSLTSCWNSSVFAVKSVSQSISISTPTRLLKCT